MMSVGVVVLTEAQPETVLRYRQVRDLVKQIEADGLDGAWLYDHLLFRPEDAPPVGQWECFSIANALAEATTQLTIGTIVACTQFRNPALLAKMATTLDEISEGRFVLGIGAGWNEPEFKAFGYPYDHRVARFAEAAQIIHALLKTGRVDFHGTYYEAADCLDIPRGPSPHGPPLLMGAFGPRMVEIAARYADWLHTSNWEQAQTVAHDVRGDSAPLVRTEVEWMAFPDLAPPPAHMRQSLYHTADDVASRLESLARNECQHAIVDVRPLTREAIARLVEGVRRYRDRA